MEQDPHDWRGVCDQFVHELLVESQISAPPVDALRLAQMLDYRLVWDSRQVGRARVLRQAGQPVIFLRPDDRPERLHWAVAHEIGEANAWEVCARLGWDQDDVLPRQREELANEIARRILLPTEWFVPAASQLERRLPQLKTQFSTASHEQIATRLLDLPTVRVVEVWDQGKLTWRRGIAGRRAASGSPLERDLRRQAFDTGQHQFGRQGQWDTSVWAIHEPDWKREIVVTVDTDTHPDSGS